MVPAPRQVSRTRNCCSYAATQSLFNQGEFTNMSIPYTVKSGDTLSSIAQKQGIRSWQEIYNHPDNAAFRIKRPNPNLIYPGDVVMLPGPGAALTRPGQSSSPGPAKSPAVPVGTRPRVKVWINAFIPRGVVGYTQNITSGPHAGKTAVPLPRLARLNPMNTFKNLDSGFLTDQRSFDRSPAASVRMQSVAEVQVSPLVMISYKHRSSGTTEVDLKTGLQLDFGVADTSRCYFQMTPKYSPTGVL
jgi:LysM domain